MGVANISVDPDSGFRAWDWWGTSYAANWYWQYYYGSGGVGLLLSCGKAFLKTTQFRQRAASETVVFMENQLNYALSAARPPGYNGGPWSATRVNLRGWHGQRDYHIAAFLDGSARYQRFDTRYLLGKNWTIWPAKPWEGQWAQYNDIDPE